MALWVQKFGGTSVGTIERIENVAAKIAQAAAVHQIVAVVSAMAGETDRLIQCAKSISAEPSAEEYAFIAATGEQVSVGLLCLALKKRGIKACALTGWQAGIITSADPRKARIERVETSHLKALLAAGIVPVVAGFQGVSEAQVITTLGRGGSDTTAVALSAALAADECQIFTDVAGIYTTDPRVVKEARLLSHISFAEMLELASNGAKVLQLRSVEFAGKYRVPLRILSSLVDDPGAGTLISYEGTPMEQPQIAGIAFNRNEAKLALLGLPADPKICAEVLSLLTEAGIEIDLWGQNPSQAGAIDLSFTVHRDDYARGQAILQSLAKRLKGVQVAADTRVAKITLVGVGLRSHPEILSQIYQIFADLGIAIQMVSTSEIKVSLVVDEKLVEAGVRGLHASFIQASG